MSVKQIAVDDIGIVSLYKRRGTKSLKISLTHTGLVRVSMPTWVSYATALTFVESRKDWILAERPAQTLILQGRQIGKAHHIHFEASTGDSVSSRVTGNQVRVLLPTGMRWDSSESQAAATTGAVKALKKEAAMLLPKRLQTLADEHGFTYASVGVKRLKGRWGSCDQHQNIILNCFLMDLPWDLIDYVLLHELTHTKIMAHGPEFWAHMATVLPTIAEARKQIKLHKPAL